MPAKARKGKLPILVFDLETSNLAANRGFIMCAAAKWVGGKEIYSWRIDDTSGYGKTPRSLYNDSAIVAPLVALVGEAEAVIAHYGTKFDLPYLNTRALAGGLETTGPVTMIDPWITARKQLRLARNDLGSLVSLLTKGGSEKYHLPWEAWHEAQFGDRAAMDKLVKYCKNDVAILEKMYLALRPVIRNHPYIGGGGEPQRCPACGGKTRSHGIRRTRHFEIQRRRCHGCGTTFDGSRSKLQ